MEHRGIDSERVSRQAIAAPIGRDGIGDQSVADDDGS